ncbi:MAG TPA: acyltransferase [Hymenobacter sp.]|jgi:peptidoglycan/LPS O-acetylase OafA/YrhL|uniref:acyltransferase family protein n=1 Tax=Hymenobacter sp. TaxID=1898978 RepID=UPI002ED7DE98
MSNRLSAVSTNEEKTIIPRPLSYQELDILHALRGFCAFYVVIYHAKYLLWSGGNEYLRAIPKATWGLLQYGAFVCDMLSSAGYEMVIFFFVLSGFFIRYAQLKKHRPTLRFYLNRAVRIYPPYLASLVLSAAVLIYVAYAHSRVLTTAPGRELNAGLLSAWNELRPFSLESAPRALGFLRLGDQFFGYNNVYWSLLPEALFYLSVPLAFWKVRYYYAISAACYFFGIVAPSVQTETGFLGSFVFLFNGYFALGVGLYDIVTTRPKWLDAFRRANGMLLTFGLGALFLALIGVAALHIRMVSGPLASLLAVLGASVLLAGRVSRQNALVRLFHEIGIFSFSLYLYHFPLLILCYVGLVTLTGDLINYPRYYWVGIPLVTAGCYALYLITERLAVRYFRGT